MAEPTLEMLIAKMRQVLDGQHAITAGIRDIKQVLTNVEGRLDRRAKPSR